MLSKIQINPSMIFRWTEIEKFPGEIRKYNGKCFLNEILTDRVKYR